MLFNSYAFILVFLPCVLVLFFAIGVRSQPLTAAFLAIASLFFYGWWDYRFVPLLAGSIAWNYASGLVIHKLKLQQRERAVGAALFVAIVGNLALLGYYKYTGFLVGVIDQTAGTHFGPLSIILPLGISFFTFTQIAFLVDTSRGEVRDFDAVRYLLFVTYFPHLIAGPILHHKEMMPQFALSRTFSFDASNFAIGIAYFSIGLAKKCLLADSFAPDASATFNAAAQGVAVSAPLAWEGILAYTLQLYFDFSGYIDMAIGLSLMFNVRLPLNFNSPYKAVNITEFWRRWHMTLSRFLRDYLYILLGGNRRGPAQRYVNLLVTMVLGGLWHGANWTFILWGGMHGAFLCINHAWRAFRPEIAGRLVPAPVGKACAILLTFLCVMVAWVVFRAADLPTAIRVLRGLVGLNGLKPMMMAHTYTDFELLLNWFGVPFGKMWVATLGLYLAGLVIVFALPNSQEIVESDRYLSCSTRPVGLLAVRWRPTVAWGAVCAMLVIASMLTLTRVSEFLYFQF